MNFSQLQYITAVNKHRNFSKAAEECGIAQSTLSREIQRLEKEFDVLIFDRSRYPVVPTMKGIDLIEQAEILLEEEKHFREIALKKSNQPEGNFRLGVQNMMAPYLLPLFIQKLSEKYPKLNIEIFELSPEQMLRRFERNELDGAISRSPFIKEGYYESLLFDEEFVLYLGPDHPLLKHKKVRWKDVPADELILHDVFKTYLPDFGSQNKTEHKQFRELGNTNFQNGSLETIRKIIDRNGGITLLPELSVLYMGNRRKKMVRPIVDPVPRQKIAFVTPRGFEKNRITKVIKKEILENIPNRN